jgi:NADH-quinone oxidoreductase subunit H
MCAMTTILFLGGWLPIIDVAVLELGAGCCLVPVKLVFVFFMFAMVKAIVPRYRYDQLMRLGWKVFLPISLFWVALTAGVLVHSGGCQHDTFPPRSRHRPFSSSRLAWWNSSSSCVRSTPC